MIQVKITCGDSVNSFLSLDRLSEFQGGLKTLTEEGYQKLKKRILSNGFCFPFFTWADGEHNYILDGHQRKKTLLRMKLEGFDIPGEFPVVFIEAEDEKQAREILLSAESRFAKIEGEGLLEFVDEFDIDLDEFDLDFDFPDEEEPEESGTSKKKEEGPLFLDDEADPVFILVRLIDLEKLIDLQTFLENGGYVYEQTEGK